MTQELAGERLPDGEERGLKFIQAAEEAITTDVQSEPSPEALDGVEFGGVGRQIDEGNAFWDDKVLRFVPARLIHDEEDRGCGECGAEVGEVGGHHGGIDLREFEGELVAGARIHCRIEPEVLVARHNDCRGLHPPTGPDASDRGFEAEASFVEEEEVVVGIAGGQFGEFFLNVAWTSASALA